MFNCHTAICIYKMTVNVYLRICSQYTCICVCVCSFISISSSLSCLFANFVVEERKVSTQFRKILITIDCSALVELDNIHWLRDSCHNSRHNSRHSSRHNSRHSSRHSNRHNSCHNSYDNGQLRNEKASINRPLSLTFK